MSTVHLAARPAHTQALWTPLTAMPGARRPPVPRPREPELRRRLRAYYLRRLRAERPR